MRTSTFTPAERALNLWASARHHSAWGGTAHPAANEALTEPLTSNPSGRPALSSDMTYDASKRKYESRQRPRIDFAVLSAIESVDRAIVASRVPDWFRRYLLYKYPMTGRFGPNAPDANHEREFVNSGLVKELLGGVDAPHATRCAAKTVRAVERAFLRVLAAELANDRSAHTGG